MNILAIDTSTASLSLALVSGGQVKGEANVNNGLVHSVQLMPCMENLFATLDFDKKDLDLIAVCIGPGSFTGIRIGVATANAISLALSIPVVSVKSLDAFAMNFRLFNGIVLTTIDAQRDTYYVGMYKADGSEIKVLEEHKIMSEAEVLEYIDACKDKVLLAGDFVEEIEKGKVFLPTAQENFIKASNVAFLGAQFYAENEEGGFAVPVYMRKSQAEIVYEEKEKKAGKVEG